MVNRGIADRGLIQLAQRSGQYRFLNADCVYEGETVHYDRITGMLEITGEPENNTAKGYFAYFELLNGYRKAVYWTKNQVEEHAKKFSKAWSQQSSPWHTQFDAMAIKTVLKSLLSKYGVVSIEFANVLANDSNGDEVIEKRIAESANGTVIAFPAEPDNAENAEHSDDEGPDF